MHIPQSGPSEKRDTTVGADLINGISQWELLTADSELVTLKVEMRVKWFPQQQQEDSEFCDLASFSSVSR
jgi:hypothetical protein